MQGSLRGRPKNARKTREPMAGSAEVLTRIAKLRENIRDDPESWGRRELAQAGRRVLEPWLRWLTDEVGLGQTTADAYCGMLWSAMMHFETLKAALTRKDLMPQTRNALRAACSRWAQYVGDKDLASVVNSLEVTKLSRARSAPRQPVIRGPLPDDKVDAMLEHLSATREEHPAWVWACVRLLVKLGLRGRVDLCEMTRESVAVAVKTGRLVIASKGDRARELPAKHVHAELEDILSWPKGWKCLADVIGKGSTNQDMVTAAYDRVRAELKCLGSGVGLSPEEVYPHRFRHTAAMRLYRKTKDLVMVQKFLGHRNIETTRRYLAGEQFDEIDDALDGLYKEN